MRILVTGGAGFIGSHIVELYLENGHEVLVLDNLSTGKESNIPPQAKLAKIDLNDSQLESVLTSFKPEVINHQAAQIDVRKSVEDPSFDAQVNIQGTLKLLEAARKSRSVKKIIFASSGGAVYGDASKVPTPETYPTHPISPYGVSKLSVEHYLHYYRHLYGLDYLALRYSNVYGPRQNPHGEAGVVAIFYQRILGKQPFTINGDGTQSRDFVFVKDVARASLFGVETDFTGAINIGTAQEIILNDLVNQMAQSIHYNQEIPHGPAKAGEQMRSCLSYQQAQKILGWQPQVTLEQGLLETANFFKMQS